MNSINQENMSKVLFENEPLRSYVGGIPLNVTLHAWPIPNIKQIAKTVNDSRSPGVFDSTASYTNYTINNLHNLNSTGYVSLDDDDDDLIDAGLTDVQTFILASVATILPLIVVVITVLCLRIAWKKYRVKKEDGYEGVLQKEESSEPSGRIQEYSLPQELKTSESQFTLTLGDESLTTLTSTHLPTLRSNGSIITMTLKNNHLIVETEETLNTPAALKIESKGTTTTFVTPADTDFAADLTYNKEDDLEGNVQTNHYNISYINNDGALIHCSPEDAEYEQDKKSSNTGLSQSDLSVSSTESRNPSYRYGNQSGYDSGGYGYPEYSGYEAHAQELFQTSLTKLNESRTYTRSLSTDERDFALRVEEPVESILKPDSETYEWKMKAEKEKRYQEEQNKPENKNLPNKSIQKGSSDAHSVSNNIHTDLDYD